MRPSFALAPRADSTVGAPAAGGRSGGDADALDLFAPVGANGGAPDQGATLLAVGPAPDAELDFRLQRKAQAVELDRAFGTNGLGLSLSAGPRGEEDLRVVLAAAGLLLPGHTGPS